MRTVASRETLYPAGRREYRAETRRWNPFVRSRQGGRVLSALKLPFLLPLPTPAGYAVLETTGWRTGRRRRKCVRAIRSGDTAYVVAIGGGLTGWVQNLLADPHVRLRHGRRWYAGTAHVVDEPAELPDARHAYVDTNVPFDYATCDMHRRGLPSRQKIVELTGAWFEGGLPIAIDLQDHR